MTQWYRKPESLRLELGGGYWLLVKKYLTAGETRHAQIKVIKTEGFKAGSAPEINLEQLGIAQAVEYLLDWNLVDPDDKPIGIAGKGYDVVAAALNNLTPEGLQVILDAIQAHAAAMEQEQAHQKKVSTGELAPSPTSTSAS